MSGGHFEYLDSRLKDEIFGYENKVKNVFEDREISELVFDVLDLIHEFDWYYSGDTGKETYLEAKAEFKKKWLSSRGVRIKHTIDKALDEVKAELYETYGIEKDGEKHDD
jgi:hypothetical protein